MGDHGGGDDVEIRKDNFVGSGHPEGINADRVIDVVGPTQCGARFDRDRRGRAAKHLTAIVTGLVIKASPTRQRDNPRDNAFLR